MAYQGGNQLHNRGQPGRAPPTNTNDDEDNPRQPQRSGTGERTRAPRLRDVKRVGNFKFNRAVTWGDKQETFEDTERRTNTARFTKRKGGLRPVDRSKDSPLPQPSTTATPMTDDPLYDGVGMGSSPASLQAGHNIDLAGFIPLVEEVHRTYCEADPTFARTVPYAMWQLANVTLLEAVVLSELKRNSDPRMSFHPDPIQAAQFGEVFVPLPIAEYLKALIKTTTPAGEMISVNLPSPAFPQGPITAAGGRGAFDAGSFGVCDANSHNVYECYVSPYVAKRLLQRTHEVNTLVLAHNATAAQRTAYLGRFGAWNPLPAGCFPDQGVATRNLLGYSRPEQLRTEAINELAACVFIEDDTILGRICYSPHAVTRVSAAVQRQRRLKSLQWKDVTTAPSLALFVVKCLLEVDDIARPLFSSLSPLHSPYAFGGAIANKANMFAYKRKRDDAAPGPAYTVNGELPDDWGATINNNYLMAGQFVAVSGLNDRTVLRSLDHRELIPPGSVEHTINLWIHRHMIMSDPRF